MNDIKVGDIVHLKSEPSVKMTIVHISEGEANCIYYRQQEGVFQPLSCIPVIALEKVC